jgi:hypothetical protein
VTPPGARLAALPEGKGRRLSPYVVTLPCGMFNPAVVAFLVWLGRRPLRGMRGFEDTP